MTKHMLSHFKKNMIAYLALFALFVALGGTAYAAVKIPQIVNSHNSAKGGITCGGACPATKVYWAYVGANYAPGYPPGAGGVGLGAGPNVYQTAVGGYAATVLHQGVGDWLVQFVGQDLTNCARFANLTHDRGSASVAGFDDADPVVNGIHVLTTNAAGQPADLDFVVLALCGSTKGLTVQAAPPAAGAH